MKSIVLIFLCLFANYAFPQNWKRINREIQKVQLRTYKDTAQIETAYQVRNHFKFLQALNVNEKNDTLFILDYFPIDSSPSFIMWNRNSTIAINYHVGFNQDKWLKDEIWETKIEDTTITTFSPPDYTLKSYMKLAKDWNLIGLRVGEQTSVLTISPCSVCLTRVIFQKGVKPQYDSIHFLDYDNGMVYELLWHY